MRFTGRALAPWHEGDQLAGLLVGGAQLPFPGCGLETELGVIVPGARGRVQPALRAVLAARRGVPARPADAQASPSALETDRQFDTLGSTYQEGDHFECNTFFRRAAAAARWNLELRLRHAGALAQQDDSGVLLHAAGGDGQGSTWSSLHVNTAISDLGYAQLAANYRACDLALEYYLPAQISLAVVDGNGGVDPDGYLLSDRLGEFDAVFGPGTMRPSRALLVDRSERFGNARIMHMLRALSFGRASSAGLVMTQLDCLVCDLVVHGALEVPAIRLGDPVAAARALSRHDRRFELAEMQRQVHDTRQQVVDGLVRELGAELVEQLVPDLHGELAFVEATLQALDRDDEAALLERCDWARKHAVLADFAGRRDRPWRALHDELVELNLHYARLDEQALRHVWPAAAMPTSHRPDPVPAETSSWLLYWLCERAERDPDFRRGLHEVEISWQGLRRELGGWAEPQGSAWPWASRRRQRIELRPWRFTAAATAERLAAVRTVDDLFAAFGVEQVQYGDYAGRSYRAADLPGPRSP